VLEAKLREAVSDDIGLLHRTPPSAIARRWQLFTRP
jgi:hypothetical protein